MKKLIPSESPVLQQARKEVQSRTLDLVLAHGQLQAQANTPQMPLLRPGRGPLQPVSFSSLGNQKLRAFVASVQDEREVRTLLQQQRTSRNDVPCTAGELLQRAAARVSYWCALGRSQREVLYVATVIAGIGRLLAPTVVGSGRVDDVLFTVVRPALHRLDAETPTDAALLRQCLGWANSDEIDEQHIPDLRRAIERALDQSLDGQDREPAAVWPN